MLYSLNRWENQALLTSLTDNADYVIADRYYPSNLAYGSREASNWTGFKD